VRKDLLRDPSIGGECARGMCVESIGSAITVGVAPFARHVDGPASRAGNREHQGESTESAHPGEFYPTGGLVPERQSPTAPPYATNDVALRHEQEPRAREHECPKGRGAGAGPSQRALLLFAQSGSAPCAASAIRDSIGSTPATVRLRFDALGTGTLGT